MSNASNLNTVDLAVNNNTPATQYYNNYFTPPSTISGNQNDAVTAYFEKITGGNKQSAAVLSSTIIFTALAQGLDPMSIIRTSLVGVNNNPVQNKYISRAILA